MSRVHTLGSRATKTQKTETQQKTQTKKPATKTKNKPGRAVGREHPNSDHWRCPECTFLNDASLTVCNTCKTERKQDDNFIAKKKPNKPSQTVSNRKSEEVKQLQSHETYYDRTDNSENVAIAGMKKYHYDPSRLPRNVPVPPAEQNSRKERGKSPSNIHTISDLPPEHVLPQNSISRPEEFKQSSASRGPNGMRDLIGMLQAADRGDEMPCMRKGTKK